MTSLPTIPGMGAAGYSAAARSHFEPVGKFMDHIDRVVSAEYGPRSTLERRDVEQISSNSFEVRYSLHDDSRARLSLTFLVVGENSDELLLQCHERSGVRDIRSNPGQFDQHVYDLNTLDPLKTAIRDKILCYLRRHYPDISTQRVERSMH